MSSQLESGRFRERSVTPIDLEGSLFAADMSEETFRLFDEIAASGHQIGLSTTAFEHKSPFFQTGYTEIIGSSAIRSYFGLSGLI